MGRKIKVNKLATQNDLYKCILVHAENKCKFNPSTLEIKSKVSKNKEA